MGDPKEFQYQRIADDHIRLIQLLPQSTATLIECSIHHSNLEEAEHSYIAFSYCWGNPAITKILLLGGHEISVTENLFHALSVIIQHHDHTTYFWIDALCINQQNIPERNHHVQRMGAVYSSAKAVYTWLGAEDGETEIAFSEIALRTNPDNSTSLSPSEQRAATAISNLASRPYFDRAWVIQEFIRAPSLLILCGRFSCDWSALHTAYKPLNNIPISTSTTPSAPTTFSAVVACIWSRSPTQQP